MEVGRSLLESRRYSPFGILTIWHVQGIETWWMIGYHAVPEIAGAFMKGIRGYDAGEAPNAMVASASYPRRLLRRATGES